MKQNAFPPGWDEKRVQSVIDYYENQTEDEAVAEAGSGLRDESITLILSYTTQTKLEAVERVLGTA